MLRGWLRRLESLGDGYAEVSLCWIDGLPCPRKYFVCQLPLPSKERMIPNYPSTRKDFSLQDHTIRIKFLY